MTNHRFERRGALAIEAAAWGISFAESKPAAFEEVDGVAVVRISGPLTQHREFIWDSYESIRARVSEALESSCSAVVLRIDSPGGDASGCFEAGRDLAALAAAKQKKIYAYADGVIASAAYAIACCATGGIYLSQTSRVGSIGVITVAVEQSAMDRAVGLNFSVIASGRRKADGHPHVPISEAAVESIQGQVNDLAEIFFAHVAASRPLTTDAVRGLEAAMFIGSRAVEAGLADGVATFDQLLAMVAGGETTSRPRAAEGNGMKFEELLAALTKAADGEGDDADKAKKMIKALEGGDDEKKKDDDKAEDESGDDEKKKDDDKAAAKASAHAVDLAQTVQQLSSEVSALKKKEAATERRDLLSSRPDFAPELVAVLKKAPLAIVRETVKNLPRAPGKKDAAAALKAVPTAAEGQGGSVIGSVTRASAQAAELDAAFGLNPPVASIRREGGTVTFAAMTPDEARRHLDSKKKKENV